MHATELVIEKNRPIDLISMGRVAVDLYAEQIGCTLAEAQSFRKYLGGCAGNIAVGSARLGLNTVMFSCVGDDEMGLFLKNTLQQEGVRTELLYESKKHLTGLVLLGIKPPKDFPLMFYRNDCADMQLKPDDAKESIIKQAKAILITGTGISTPSMRETTHFTIELARKLGTLVIMDLDYRPVLWGLTALGNGEARYLEADQVSQVYQAILPFCDLIVGTEEEICIAGGNKNINQAMKFIRSLTTAPMVVKKGERGCQVFFNQLETPLESKPFPVDILNVLGAGDGFMSGLLRGLLRNESWEAATTYANACGALVVTRHGCSVAIPYWNELQQFIADFDQKKSQIISKANFIPPPFLIKHPYGFYDGINSIVKIDRSFPKTEMNFSSVKLRQGQQFEFDPRYEFAALLMTGKVIFHYANSQKKVQRYDYFAQTPIVLHCPEKTLARVEALTDCEVLVIETENEQSFAPLLFDQTNILELDHRGKDLLQNTSYRLVRTVFDKRNRPESNLVVGEIISFQGNWSSYPPHYHSQAEIYHYRFSEPQGFAFGQNGKEVIRVEHNDTYLIASDQEHAHCTAPGYAMYTLWFIRHQQDNPYITPTFLPEHEWTRHSTANERVWQAPKLEKL